MKFTRGAVPLATTVAAVLVLLGGHVPATAAQVTPVKLIDADFADPDVLRTDAGYFAYSTSNATGKVPYASAANADGPWTLRGDALARVPAWAAEDGGFWAPDVVRRDDGRFLLYYTGASKNGGPMCIGAALGDAPGGPFEPVAEQPLICVPEDSGDIDPQTFVDDGRRYLLYKSNGGAAGPPSAIWLQELTADGLATTGSRRELLRADLQEEKGVVEAPVVVRRPSKYLLFYAADTYESSTYHTSYATAPTLTGPFVKAPAPLLSTAGLGGQVDGPGGADVLEDRIFFHSWLTAEHTARGLFSLPLTYRDDLPGVG
ncbi:glycoside hydrolase family 43 protein [Amycolatopsis magusensis]|uniref:glycoside hydrolase family 43 protein n=1 Tax=Amycolatopsis magusensis TaxID=882444 RepID=UPI0024A7D9F2|nr:glycoside hydrolase family 43 protein [Amycolatopsis magusensis]MDI5978824.1 glycoside hydrolase family 43 protein [Amycolatopsis magusensis]